MAEGLNGAAVPSQVSSGTAASRSRAHVGTAASRSRAHVWWGVLLAVIGIAAVSAIVVTAVMGLTTEALIIAIFTGAFFSRCAC